MLKLAHRIAAVEVSTQDSEKHKKMPGYSDHMRAFEYSAREIRHSPKVDLTSVYEMMQAVRVGDDNGRSGDSGQLELLRKEATDWTPLYEKCFFEFSTKTLQAGAFVDVKPMFICEGSREVDVSKWAMAFYVWVATEESFDRPAWSPIFVGEFLAWGLKGGKLAGTGVTEPDEISTGVLATISLGTSLVNRKKAKQVETIVGPGKQFHRRCKVPIYTYKTLKIDL